MELSEREAHCVARLLQGAWFAKHSLDACNYCKFRCFKNDAENRLSGFENIRRRLTEETGVDISPAAGAFLIDSEFPYHKFLKNSNEEIRKYFRERFSNF